MSRILSIAILVAIAFAARAAPIEIDLDRPGALEALERERPAHHRQVMDAISRAQTIYYADEATPQRADLQIDDPRRLTAGIVLPSSPAKRRLFVSVGDYHYRVTAHMTEHPGKSERAK